MRIRVAVPDEHVTPEVIGPVLEAVTRLDEHMIRSGQTPTSHELIRGGAIWRPENPGDEHFDHGGTIAQRGWGDCDDWAPLHAATLRATGEDPGATAFIAPSGPNTFHALVRRSNGAIDDPSVAAGMKPTTVVGQDGEPNVWVCDPHDGRVYQGALAPTTGPLSLHCGAQLRVRGCMTSSGPLYQARVDLPISGSRLVHVRAHKRKHHHGRRVHGAVLPYAMSVTHLASTRDAAMSGALVGAVLAADACDLTTSLDRYKLLAVQSAMAGMGSEDLRNGLYMQLQGDFAGREDCLQSMLYELGAPITTDFLHDAWTLASAIVLAIGSVQVGDFLSDAIDTIAKPVEAVYNAIPTPVKAVLAPASLVTEYAYAHPESIPLFGDIAKKAKTMFENARRGGSPIDQAVQMARQAIHPAVVPATHSVAAQVMHAAPFIPAAPPPPPFMPQGFAPPPMPAYAPPMPAYAPPPMPAFDPYAAFAQAPSYDDSGGYGGDDSYGVQGAQRRRKPLGVAHAAVPIHPRLPPHPTAAPAPRFWG